MPTVIRCQVRSELHTSVQLVACVDGRDGMSPAAGSVQQLSAHARASNAYNTTRVYKTFIT